MKSFIYICFIVCIACLVHTTAVFARELYGAADDASWAILSTQLSDILGQGKQALYDNHIEDCTKSELGEHCFEDDEWRMVMNRDQPPSVYNYTHTGYQKIRVPPELFELIRAFWERNKNRLEPEYHQEVNTYHNMWDSAPDIIKLGDVRNDGGGLSLKQKITDLARLVLEDWTGQKLRAVSLYGIRVYHNNSLLAPHVDRLPLVTSAISKCRTLATERAII